MKTALVLVALLISLPADAATFYASLTGSDAVSCATAQTIGTPKRSISAALACASAGDTVYIRGGTYTTDLDMIDSNLYTVPSGSSGNLITIAGYPGDADVTIRPANDVQILRLQTGAPHHLVFQDIIFDGVNSTKTAALYLSGGAHHIRFFQIELTRAYFFGVLVVSSAGDYTGFNEFVNSEFHNTGDPASTDNTRGHALYIETADNLVEGNYIHDNEGYGVNVYENSGPQSVSRNVIRNNRIYNNGLGHASAYGVLVAWGSDNLVYNNKIYGNNAGVAVYSNSTNAGVYNNTIVDNLNEGVRMEFYANAPLIKNNIIYLNGSTVVDLGGTGTPVQSNNLTSDPTFVNALIHDYHLQSGSAAKDAGATIAAVTTDFDGVSRPQNLVYDIGAFEYVAGGGGDVTAPVVVISTNGGVNFSQTSSTTVALAGTCTDAVGCTDVSVTSDTCGTYTAAGTAEWTVNVTIARDVTCLITLHGVDAASNDGHDTITVTVLTLRWRPRRIGP